MKLQQTDLPNFKYLYEKALLCNGKKWSPAVSLYAGFTVYCLRMYSGMTWNIVKSIYRSTSIISRYILKQTCFQFYLLSNFVTIKWTAILHGNACIAWLKSVRSYVLMSKFYEGLIWFLAFVLSTAFVFFCW